MPLFALANAGVVLGGDTIDRALRSPVTIGIVVGLVVGKTVGIGLFSWLALKLGVARLPPGLDGLQIAAVAVVAGIGFTVSLFITNLAFTDARLIDEAKIAILGASAFMGMAGYAALRLLPPDASRADEPPGQPMGTAPG